MTSGQLTNVFNPGGSGVRGVSTVRHWAQGLHTKLSHQLLYWRTRVRLVKSFMPIVQEEGITWEK